VRPTAAAAAAGSDGRARARRRRFGRRRDEPGRVGGRRRGGGPLDDALDRQALLLGQVVGDLARQVLLPGGQEGLVGLGEAPAAGVGQTEVADRPALAGIDVAALLEGGGRRIGVTQLEQHQPEVQVMGRVAGHEPDQAAIDRQGLGELAGAKVGQAEERQGLAALRHDVEGTQELALGLVEAALAQELTTGDQVVLVAIEGQRAGGVSHRGIITRGPTGVSRGGRS
jgi:hypothetical protein